LNHSYVPLVEASIPIQNPATQQPKSR